MKLIIPDQQGSREHHLQPGTTLLGRSSECDVRFDSKVVSARHACISYDERGVFVRELGSSNGLLVDNQYVGNSSLVPLKDGSQLQLGTGGPVISISMPGHVAASKPTSTLLMTTFGCLVMLLFAGLIGLAVTSYIYFDSNAITAIERNQSELADAVGLVVVGLEGIPKSGKRQIYKLGTGSGFLVSSDGYVFTNRHVVANAVSYGNNQTIKLGEKVYDKALIDKQLNTNITNEQTWVIFDGNPFEANIVYVSERYDFSILKVDIEEAPFFRVAETDKLESTSQVFALGYPGIANVALSQEELESKSAKKKIPHYRIEDSFSQDELVFSITKGIVSRTKVEDTTQRTWIQHQATVNHGNSGGPLCTPSAIVVGLNTSITPDKTAFFSLTTGQLKQEIEKHVPDIEWADPT